MILFLGKRSKYIFYICRSLSGWSLKYLLLFGLLLQSCAITTSETKIVPGKELSKVSLGLREIENTNFIKELTPNSVSVYRKVCEAELFRIKYKGMRETVHKRQELNCATAYPEYLVFQLTTFGIPFLYDMVSGFGIFREKCDKGPLKITTDIQETNTTLSQDILDTKNTICKDVPIPNAEITAEINQNISNLTSSSEGIVTLTPELMNSVESLERDVSVRYRYMAETKYTTIKQAAKPTVVLVAEPNDKNTSETKTETGIKPTVEAPVVKKNEAVASLPAVNNGDASKLLPAVKRDEVSKFLTISTQSSAPEPQVVAKTDAQNADAGRSKGASDATVENKNLQTNKVSEKTNKLSNDIMHTAPVESKRTAKVEGPNDSVKNDIKTNVLNQDQNEVKAYELTLAFLSQYGSGFPGISPLRRQKLVETFFKVEYEFNKADVNEESREDLKTFAEILKNNPNTVSVIEGHTDNLGAPEVNRKMSLRRASAIKDVFVNKYGIAANRIQIYGYGLTKPIADNTLAEGRAKNRRSEIYTTGAPTGL